MSTKSRGATTLVFALSLLIAPAIAFAATTPTLNQTINPGTLTADILQADGTTPVATPAVGFSAVTKSLTCQTTTATLGDSANRLYVSNLAANGGWTLAMAAASGPTATWTAGANTYKYNDATNTGCANGQMTINPTVATVNLDCSSTCSAASVSKGAQASYVSGTTDSVTLMSSNSGAGWRGYLTGVGLSQKVPANQASGSYSLPMTLTVTAQ